LITSTYSFSNAEEVQHIHEISNRGLYGYTLRETDFISKRSLMGGYTPENISVYRSNSEIVGYVAFRAKSPSVVIGEIRAVDGGNYMSILRMVEKTYAGLPIRVDNGFSIREMRWLRETGFKIQPGAHTALMMRGMNGLSIGDVKRVLGTEEGLFRQPTLFDMF